MGQNALDQSDYKIFKSIIKWWKSLIFCMLIQKKNIGVGMVKNGCDHSVLRTLKLAACQREKMDGIN